MSRLIKLIKNHDALIYAGKVCKPELIPEEIKRASVDILFINPKMLVARKRRSPLHFIRSIKKRFRDLKLVIFTKDKELLFQLIQVKLAGYLLKTEEEESQIIALKRIANNRTYYAQDITEKIIIRTRQMSIQSKLVQLSDREKQILALVGQKLTNEKIAQELNIGLQTVRTHLNRIYNKLGIPSRQEAIEYAAQFEL